MIHTRKEQVTEERETPTAIDCDCCGKRLSDNGQRYGDVVSICYVGGYASPVVGDGAEWGFEVCEPCLAAWVATFKGKIRKRGGWLEYTLEPDEVKP